MGPRPSRRAGVSHAAAYKHFDDKAALLAELAIQGFDQLSAATRAARSSGAAPAVAGSIKDEFIARCRAYVRFGTAHANLYRLMFSGDVDKKASTKLDAAAESAFAELLAILERGQRNGAFKKQPVRGQAATAWSLVHGYTLLAMDGQLLPEKVGAKPIDAVLTSLLEGLDN